MSEQTPTSFNLGVVRVYIENQLIGFVGASAHIEAQLQVMVKDNEQQIVAGQPRGGYHVFRSVSQAAVVSFTSR
ncbi:hypothetical protein O5699_22885 [Escherichia coli]|nr:hypothetical protein [Escherichia coli]